jgi:hypothetical protein
MFFLIPESIISTATESKNGDCEKKEIISPMTFIPHIILARREVRRFYNHLKQGISNDFMYCRLHLKSAICIENDYLCIVRYSEIQEVVISIYDVL